jgi:UDP-4-amino-4,6-dideoxy-N-acetyl-beta-L-altrosamine transaminase
MIPYGRQHISSADIDAVVEVLRSDWLTQGPAVPKFEEALAGYCDARHAVAVGSATAALHVAYAGLGLGPGDVLWTSPITFVATANAARYCGADVDFVDIDPMTRCMSVDALAGKLREAESRGRLPKIVVPVHFAGQSCDMAAVRALADRYGFRVVEDACHALGGQYGSRPVGSCCHSDAAVFSFHPVKSITTGEGGAVLTNDGALAARMARLRSHGITRDPEEMEGEGEGGWYYQQVELGWNYRMTDIQAALGTSQLQRLDDFVAKRRALAVRYDHLLSGLPLRRPLLDGDSAWHIYAVCVAGADRRTIYDLLRSTGIGVGVHYIPVHLQPAYRRLDFKPGAFPEAEAYYAGALSLPLYPDLSENEQECVVGFLQQSML